MLEKVIETTNLYIDSMPKKERKKCGQFFTSMETARFNETLKYIRYDLLNERRFVYEKKNQKIFIYAGHGGGTIRGNADATGSEGAGRGSYG